MFEKYIEEYKNLYGPEFVTSNIHNLQHVVNDVRRFGCLSTISSYPFENCLFQIKNLIRQGNHNLQQVANRIHEKNIAEQTPHQTMKKYPCLTTVRNTVHCKIDVDVSLSNAFHDSWFLSNNNEIVQMSNAAYDADETLAIYGRSIVFKQDFFVIPVRSSKFHIYLGNISRLTEIKSFKIENIFCKLVAIPYHHQIVFIPLQHTLKQKSA